MQQEDNGGQTRPKALVSGWTKIRHLSADLFEINDLLFNTNQLLNMSCQISGINGGWVLITPLH